MMPHEVTADNGPKVSVDRKVLSDTKFSDSISNVMLHV